MEPNTSETAPTRATPYNSPKDSQPNSQASGTMRNATPPTSAAPTITGRLRYRSASTPAGSDTSKGGSFCANDNSATCQTEACSATTAISGMAT